MSRTAKSRQSVSASSRRVVPAQRGMSTSLLVGLMLLATGAGMRDAFGQDPSGVQPDGSEDGKPAVDLAPPSDPANANGDANASPEEMLTRAKQFVAGIEQSSGSISRQLQAARKERDVVRVLCLNDKLNQVDVALGSAQDRLGALRTAVESSDVDRSRHEYTVLEVLNDRVRVLVNESNQCVGEETGFIGDTEVSVSVDPNLPNADTKFDANSNSPPPPPNISSPIE